MASRYPIDYAARLALAILGAVRLLVRDGDDQSWGELLSPQRAWPLSVLISSWFLRAKKEPQSQGAIEALAADSPSSFFAIWSLFDSNRMLLERPAQLAYDATESLDITRASGAFKFAAQQLGSNRLGAALNSAFYTNASGDIGRKLPPPAALIAGEQNPKPYFSQLWSAVDASAELAVIPAALAESAGDAVAPTNYGMQSPQLSELDHCMTLLMSRGMSRERAAQVCEGPAKSSAAPTELNEAKAVALRTNRPLLVLVSASWCGPCQMFNRQLKTNQSLADEVGRFVYASWDVDTSQVAARLGEDLHATAYPTFVMFSPDGEEKGRLIGFREPAGFQAWLRKFPSPRTLDA